MTEATGPQGKSGWRLLEDVVLLVRGADRESWLAGMVTQDTRSLAQGGSVLAAVVHEKGKLLSVGYVHKRADAMALVLPRGTEEPVREHFERHVIMEDVELSLSEERVLTVQGADAEARVRALGLSAWSADRLGEGGVDLCVSEGDLERVQGLLEQAGLERLAQEQWESARLSRGVPAWGPDYGGENYVQEAGLTRRAVSFQKGCYCGQEVVCRLEMRGHVRRQLVLLEGEGAPPAVGAALDDGAGQITSAATSGAGYFALAMVKWDVVADPARALSLAGAAVQRRASPWMKL